MYIYRKAEIICVYLAMNKYTVYYSKYTTEVHFVTFYVQVLYI